MSDWNDLARRIMASLPQDILDGPTPVLGDKLVLAATKHGAVLPFATDQLMDEGLIPDTRPARPRRAPRHVTTGTLARAWTRDAAAGARLRAGSWIAGMDLADRDDETEEDW